MLTPVELYHAITVCGVMLTHPNHSDLLIEKTSCGSLICYSKIGQLHNPYGGAIMHISGRSADEYYVNACYLNGVNVSIIVADLIACNGIDYDDVYNIWDESSLITIAMTGA